jgi:hypothetical protein
MSAMNITREQIESSLKAIIAKRNMAVDKVPDGWVSTNDAAEIAGLSASRMRKHLSHAVKNGEIPEPKTFRIQVGSRVIPVPHFLVVSTGKINS